MSDDDGLFSHLFKQGTILFVGLILELGISFLGKALIARILDKTQYGGVSLGVSILTISSIVAALGMETGVARFIPRFENDPDRADVVKAGFQLVVPSALLLGGTIFVASPYLARTAFGDPNLTPVLRIFSIGIPFAALSRLIIGSLRGLEASLPVVYVKNFLTPVARLSLIVGLLVYGLGEVGVATAYAGAHIIAGTAGLYLLWDRIPAPIFGRKIKQRKALLRFSLPLTVMSGAAVLFNQSDTLLLGYLSQNAAPVGDYNVIYPLSQLISMPLTAFLFIFMPVLSGLHARSEHDQMNQVYRIITKWIFLLTIPLFGLFILLPSTVISLTFGAEYANAGTALVVLCAGFFIDTLFGPNRDTLISIGRTKLVMYDSVVTAGLNLVLNILLIPSYSFLGAAVATAISYAALNTMMSYQVYRETGISSYSSSLAKLSISAIIVLIGLKMIMLQGATSMTVFILYVIAGLGYLVLSLRLGVIEQAEVQLVLDLEESYDLDLGPLKRIAKVFIPTQSDE